MQERGQAVYSWNRSALEIDNADIGFRNFEGREGHYNRRGDRSFVVFIEDEIARELESKGWNVKWPKENDNIPPEEDTRRPYFQVAINPERATVMMVTDLGNGDRTINPMTEESMHMLDWAELELVRLSINPYKWTHGNDTGVKAYLNTGYFHVITDSFAQEYYND